MLKALVKKIFGGNDKKSRSLAKSRLHFVLVQDRTGLTNDQMAQFRKELVEVIQRYFTIDETGFDISYERHEESTTLLINSPVVVK
ncbi:cell division topological specificity factor MinE, partial [bacterium]|nr:cell division topological specificity factor MinE [bacterium]